MARIPTQLKVASGYIMLTILLFASVRYIYGKMTAMTQTDKKSEMIYKRWKATYDVADRLYQLEITSQPMNSGFTRHYPLYENAMREANNSIDSLRILLADSIQVMRLDSVKALLKEKDGQVKEVYGIVRNMQGNSAYQKQIDRLIAEQDTIVARPKTYRDTITKTSSYSVHKKEGLFKRIRNVFVPAKADSTHVSQVTTQVSVDSTEKVFNPADTVATMLKDVQHEVETTRYGDRRQLDRRIMALYSRGQEINDKVNALMTAMEKEEHMLAAKYHERQEAIRKRSATTMAAIAVAAVLLAVFFMIMIWRDITRSNHYRRELEKAKSKAENLLGQREQLMLTITHDIKAPVGSILGYTDLLAAEDIRQKSYIDNVRASARHLLDMISSLLDYHRLDSNKMDADPMPFDPCRLFDTIYESFRPMAEEKHLKTEYRCGISAGKVFIGDSSRIRQITENLLSNALKFTDEGSIALSIGQKGRQLHMEVSDTGRGIAHEDKERMFAEFTRLANAQGQEGFGLGLSITKKMVHLLGGEITVESKLGEGSIFSVCLPIEEKPAEIAGNDKEFTGIHLLVVDDDFLQLRLTKDMLATKGIDVTPCTQPERISDILRKNSFDAVLTDIQMPAMNGFELIRRIRLLPSSTGSIPVIAVTACSDMNSEGLKSHGFAACLHKPYNVEELMAAISEATHLNTVSGLNFNALVRFAGDDKEAAKEIMKTFVEETRKNVAEMERASRRHDVETVIATAHRMLPLFVQIEAHECTPALEWLEKQCGKKEYSEDFDRKVKITIQGGNAVIEKAVDFYLFSS